LAFVFNTLIVFIFCTGGNDTFTKRLSVVGPTHERDILAKTVVRGPRTVPHEIRMERNRNGRRVVTDHN